VSGTDSDFVGGIISSFGKVENGQFNDHTYFDFKQVYGLFLIKGVETGGVGFGASGLSVSSKWYLAPYFCICYACVAVLIY